MTADPGPAAQRVLAPDEPQSSWGVYSRIRRAFKKVPAVIRATEAFRYGGYEVRGPRQEAMQQSRR
jgi:hypothetical protein